MRTVEILSILGTLLGGFASGMAALEKKLVKKLRDRGATSEKKAVELQKLRPLSLWRISRLKRANAIKEVESGKLYFDESAFRALRKKRALIAITLIVVSVFLFIIFHR